MTNILILSRNRCTGVEQVDDHTMRSPCRLQDTLADAFVEIMVKLPDLDTMMVDSYKARGWDEEGYPTPEKLADLGITTDSRCDRWVKKQFYTCPVKKEIGMMEIHTILNGWDFPRYQESPMVNPHYEIT